MERPTRHTALWQVTKFECMRCLDTALILKDGELFDCPNCHSKEFAHLSRIAHLETAVLKQKATGIPQRDFDLACALVLTTKEHPIKARILARFLNCDVPAVMHSAMHLHRDWTLPISAVPHAEPTYYWND